MLPTTRTSSVGRAVVPFFVETARLTYCLFFSLSQTVKLLLQVTSRIIPCLRPLEVHTSRPLQLLPAP
jgi:hypothetical protein